MTLAFLEHPRDPSEVGGKFAQLAAAARLSDVPWACCVPVSWFERCLGEARLAALDRLMIELRATLGYRLPHVADRVDQILSGIALSGDLERELAEVVESRPAPPNGFVIRSSPIGDDSATSPQAGTYHATLGARTVAEVVAAILACWRASYSPRALAARIRRDDWSPRPHIGVIVQEEVAEPALHGVTVVADRAARRLIDGRRDETAWPTAEAAAAASLLAARWGKPLEVEWLWDGRLQVVQVRLADGVVSSADRFEVARLYAAPVSNGFELADCAAIYDRYVSKRRWAYDAAAETGVPTGAGYVLSFTGPGLAANLGRLDSLLRETRPTEVVIDVAPGIRQILLPKTDATAFLTEIFPAQSRRHCVDAVIVRDFVDGQGIIASAAGDGRFLVEYADDGLMELNRGVAAGSRTIVDGQGRAHDGEVSPEIADQLRAICRFTRRLDARVPGIQAEWVLTDGEAYFIDYTAVSSSRDRARTSGHVVSRGSASGPAIVVDDDFLRPLSIGAALSAGESNPGAAAAAVVEQLAERFRTSPRRPVVVARRPYAILASLIDYAEGFVFEEGSVLCHLAVTLREFGCPAVISNTPIRDGDEIHLDDGELFVVRRPSDQPPLGSGRS